MVEGVSDRLALGTRSLITQSQGHLPNWKESLMSLQVGRTVPPLEERGLRIVNVSQLERKVFECIVYGTRLNSLHLPSVAQRLLTDWPFQFYLPWHRGSCKRPRRIL